MLFDTSLTMKKQVAMLCIIVSRNIVRRNSKYLLLEPSKKLASGLVMAILDYGNTSNFGLLNRELNKLQRFQDYAAKPILGRNRNNSATFATYLLH